jgi:hypothetical protein
LKIETLMMMLVAGLAFGFGSFARSGLEDGIEAMDGLYDLAVLDAGEDDSIAAIKGGITSCSSGLGRVPVKYIV